METWMGTVGYYAVMVVVCLPLTMVLCHILGLDD